MADHQYTARRHVNEKTLFDDMGSGIDVNLKMGSPGDYLLRKSNELMKKATLHRLGESDAFQLFQYGPEAGDIDFRKELAGFLTKEYMDDVRVDDLIVTSGATQGLVLLSRLFFSSGDTVFVEDPTYFIALRALQNDCGLKCIPSPMDGEGIIPDELERRLETHLPTTSRESGGTKPFSSMLYLVPTFHNPTGACLSPDRCRQIVEIARKYNLLVVCDDVYNLLAFSQDEASHILRKRLFAYDNPNDSNYAGNVVSNATFSKLFGPGLRLGWLEAPPRVRDVVLSSGQVLSGGSLNHLTSGLMARVISQGLLQQHVQESRSLYKDQCEAVCSVLRDKLPSATFTDPQGGYFLWMKLPSPLKAADVVSRCEQELKITFFTGDLASPTSHFKDYVRISFSFYSVDVLTSAMSKVADLINSMLNSEEK
jgi:DNA-binding transcriptional MocR family regulator